MNEAPIPLDEALDTLSQAAPRPSSETLALDEAFGRVLAADLVSLVDHPSLDDSALDGFACRAADTVDATPERPVRLRLVGEVPAGRPFEGHVGAGEAVRIYTGGAIPSGADAIVAVENSRVEQSLAANAAGTSDVWLSRPASPSDVRHRGRNLEAGTTYLRAGRRLDAGALGLAAMMGHASAAVARRPHLALLTTGDEVITPGTPLAPGQVYDGNAASLAALAKAAGARLTRLPRARDDPEELRAAFDEAVTNQPPIDLLLTSGGVSMGKYDIVRDLMLGHGEVAFWKVAIRPGGPALFGRYAGLNVLALPGNPVSSMVVFLLLGRAFTDAMLGRSDPIPARNSLRATALTDFRHAGAKTAFQRATFETRTGPGVARPLAVRGLSDQSSGVARSMAEADALVRVPPGRDVAAGDEVDVLPLAPHLG